MVVRIRKSLSAKLSLAFLMLSVPIFMTALSVLFSQSHKIIRNEAVGRANSVLSTTMQRINRHLLTIETATNANLWMVEQSLRPDSLFEISHRIVSMNPHVDGCSISAEPELFKDYGRYFSVYSVRESDSVSTVYEEEYEYFSKKWYRTPYEKGPCWVAYYDEADSLELTIDGMVASYGRPIYKKDSTIVGIISSDLSLLRLSKVMSQEKPYPHSYFMMIDEEGRYFVHPDSTRLFNHTIFGDVNPHEHPDVIALGYEMTGGKEGQMNVVIDGEECLVCYQPVPGTTWSLAIVCPDSDILAGYHQLTTIVITLLIIGLIVILMLSYKTVATAIRPLSELLNKTKSIAEGDTEVFISKSKREDVIGRLQNSFASMVQSLNIHMGIAQFTSDQTQLRNEELALATQQAMEAEKQKTNFIQNVTHQIRTPLNIIMGFIQILSDTSINTSDDAMNDDLSEEERKGIIDTMLHNSIMLYRMVLMLFDSSETGHSEELLTSSMASTMDCRQVAIESQEYMKLSFPDLTIKTEFNIPENLSIKTNQLYVLRSLRELLYNAAKYSDGQHIVLRVESTDTKVLYIVEDTGKSIPEAERERVFKFFTKVDDLSEGLGLGLPLSKRHAQNLGGDLTLDATYKEGCRFIFELPRKQP